MARAVSPDVLTEAQIVREAIGPKPLPPGTPEFVKGAGADGHAYEYRVTGVRENGELILSSWDASHLSSCRCSDPDLWY